MLPSMKRFHIVVLLCFHALLFANLSWKLSRLAFCSKMYAIWVINESIVWIRVRFFSSFFLYIWSTQNGSPFVIRDVFMCSRLENQSLFSFQSKREEKKEKKSKKEKNCFSCLRVFWFFFLLVFHLQSLFVVSSGNSIPVEESMFIHRKTNIVCSFDEENTEKESERKRQ